MLRPDKPSVNFYDTEDDLIKECDYNELSKYCDELEDKIKELGLHKIVSVLKLLKC